MRKIALAAAVLVVIAACGTSEGGQSANPTAATSTTGAGPITSTSTDTTTTDAGITTTTSDRQKAPDFTLELGDGGSYTLSEGEKPVYLVFWAEW